MNWLISKISVVCIAYLGIANFSHLYNKDEKNLNANYYVIDNPKDTVFQIIEFPANNKKILYNFFESLNSLAKEPELVRILHYGDSQIEGDRISSYMRKKLQSQFGGSGCGLQPISQSFMYKNPMEIKLSKGWFHYSAYWKTDTLIKHKRYGVLANYCTFTPFKKDTATKNSGTKSYFNVRDLLSQNIDTVSVTYTIPKNSPESFKNIKQCRLIYGYNNEPVNVQFLQNGKRVSVDTLEKTSDTEVKTWFLAESTEKLEFVFSGTNSPEFYGMAFDGTSGVAVDNIPLRGCSGTMFTSMNLEHLSELYNVLNVRLLILQFGDNVIPYIGEDAKNYGQFFAAQLRNIRKIMPEIPIIIIGPADMAKKDEKNQYTSYTSVALVRDELKKAAFRYNCAFWDMYEAMGGQNSIVSWVSKEPPLAEKDYTHFTPNGSQIIAKKFYNAFISEYNQYLKSIGKTNK